MANTTPCRSALTLSIMVFLIGLAAAPSSRAADGEGGDKTKLADIEAYNYVLGTQTIGVTYAFTDDTRLVETARAILEMGSNVLKVSMSPNYHELYDLPKSDAIDSLTELARDEPSFKAVLDMPFAHYHIWTYPFYGGKGGSWQNGLSEEERKSELREIYELTRYLLTAYTGTGKTFYLGHWEGDWHLRPDFNWRNAPSPELLQRMTDWLNVRQKAIDDAKRDTPHQNVQVYHYTEVNLVRVAMSGGVALANSVLPNTNVDFVSHSAYEVLWGRPGPEALKQRLFEALDYIESKLPPKPDITGKRVYIGEYGFPTSSVKTPERQEELSRAFARAALEWGCPFVLYWEMYCNEIRDGVHMGLWMIDDKGEKQPIYYTHQRYYKLAKQWVADFKERNGKLPTPDEFRKAAVGLLDEAAPDRHVGEPPS